MPSRPSHSSDTSPLRRVEVVQTALDQDADRDEAPPFATTPIKLADFGFMTADEDEYGDSGAATLFTGLYGLLPETSTAPFPICRKPGMV